MNRPTLNRAFTLLEILVVLVIVGVVASVVALRFGGDRPAERIRGELDRFAARLDAQCDQALLQGRSIGLRVTRHGYDFWQAADDGWRAVHGNPALNPRSWPQTLAVGSAVAGQRPVALDDDAPRPQILCGPLGEVTPLELTLTSAGRSGTIAYSAGRRVSRSEP